MNRITESIFVGDVLDAGAHEAYRRNGIAAVLKLNHSDPEQPYPDDVVVREIPMIDGPRNDEGTMQEAVETLLDLRADHPPVFVHCAAGASRSVSVTAAALAIHRDVPVSEAFELVGERRPVSQPHPALVEQADRIVARLRP